MLYFCRFYISSL